MEGLVEDAIHSNVNKAHHSATGVTDYKAASSSGGGGDVGERLDELTRMVRSLMLKVGASTGGKDTSSHYTGGGGGGGGNARSASRPVQKARAGALKESSSVGRGSRSPTLRHTPSGGSKLADGKRSPRSHRGSDAASKSTGGRAYSRTTSRTPASKRSHDLDA